MSEPRGRGNFVHTHSYVDDLPDVEGLCVRYVESQELSIDIHSQYIACC